MTATPSPEPPQPAALKICTLCMRSKDRVAKTTCYKCSKPVCREHSSHVCTRAEINWGVPSHTTNLLPEHLEKDYKNRYPTGTRRGAYDVGPQGWDTQQEDAILLEGPGNHHNREGVPSSLKTNESIVCDQCGDGHGRMSRLPLVGQANVAPQIQVLEDAAEFVSPDSVPSVLIAGTNDSIYVGPKVNCRYGYYGMMPGRRPGTGNCSLSQGDSPLIPIDTHMNRDPTKCNCGHDDPVG
ncbi:hypothetical protein Pmani_003929 [Petrolisthes manimaculis]|uniref:Uncharacterized protein n=1 Tax=Petrolisthes manimaculis TaxID=1843537 RepID=A0AAE1QFL9_9EUCA|nr:hypothetical protein Pmani_003929 [Petrolisthes manimaculis]